MKRAAILLWVLLGGAGCLDDFSGLDPLSFAAEAPPAAEATVSTVVHLEAAAPIEVSPGAAADVQLMAAEESSVPGEPLPVRLYRTKRQIGVDGVLVVDLPTGLPSGALFHIVVRLDGNADGGICGGGNDYFGVSSWFGLDDGMPPDRLSVPLATLAPHLPCVAL